MKEGKFISDWMSYIANVILLFWICMYQLRKKLIMWRIVFMRTQSI